MAGDRSKGLWYVCTVEEATITVLSVGFPKWRDAYKAMCTQANAEGDFTLIQWPQHFWSPKPQTVITMEEVGA